MSATFATVPDTPPPVPAAPSSRSPRTTAPAPFMSRTVENARANVSPYIGHIRSPTQRRAELRRPATANNAHVPFYQHRQQPNHDLYVGPAVIPRPATTMANTTTTSASAKSNHASRPAGPATPRPQKRPNTSAPHPLTIGNYRLDKVIGKGTYGKVRLGIHIQTNAKVAIKIMDKSSIHNYKQILRIQREIRFLKLLNHPHIVQVHEVYETQDHIFMVMEFVSGGELFDYIVAHKKLKENVARSFFRMVLSAVNYCHQNAVVHRDLKPENLLLDESQKVIKIIDFGFGNTFTPHNYLDTFCGSPFYAAPEMILGRKYEGPEVDMWSLGVILFALLCGHLPFDDENVKDLYAKISAGVYSAPNHLSPTAKDLIQRLITVDPRNRATLQEVMHHPWVNEGRIGIPDSHIPPRPPLTSIEELNPDIVQRLHAFGYTREAIHMAFFGDPAMQKWVQDFERIKLRKRRSRQTSIAQWNHRVPAADDETRAILEKESSSNLDMIPPNPIRATYYLFDEMIKRELSKRRLEEHVHSSESLASAPSQASLAPSEETITDQAEDVSTCGTGLDGRPEVASDGNRDQEDPGPTGSPRELRDNQSHASLASSSTLMSENSVEALADSANHMNGVGSEESEIGLERTGKTAHHGGELLSSGHVGEAPSAGSIQPLMEDVRCAPSGPKVPSNTMVDMTEPAGRVQSQVEASFQDAVQSAAEGEEEHKRACTSPIAVSNPVSRPRSWRGSGHHQRRQRRHSSAAPNEANTTESVTTSDSVNTSSASFSSNGTNSPMPGRQWRIPRKRAVSLQVPSANTPQHLRGIIHRVDADKVTATPGGNATIALQQPLHHPRHHNHEFAAALSRDPVSHVRSATTLTTASTGIRLSTGVGPQPSHLTNAILKFFRGRDDPRREDELLLPRSSPLGVSNPRGVAKRRNSLFSFISSDKASHAGTTATSVAVAHQASPRQVPLSLSPLSGVSPKPGTPLSYNQAASQQYYQAKDQTQSDFAAFPRHSRYWSDASGARSSSCNNPKPKIRTVSGWFFSVSTTSRKKPRHIMREIQRVLRHQGNVTYFYDGGYVIEVTYEPSKRRSFDIVQPLAGGTVRAGALNNKPPKDQSLGVDDDDEDKALLYREPSLLSEENDDEESLPPPTALLSGGPRKNSTKDPSPIIFEIEICRVTRVGMYGIRFKRLQGSLWTYKKVCNKLLSQFNL